MHYFIDIKAPCKMDALHDCFFQLPDQISFSIIFLPIDIHVLINNFNGKCSVYMHETFTKKCLSKIYKRKVKFSHHTLFLARHNTKFE